MQFNYLLFFVLGCAFVGVQGGKSPLPSKKHWGYNAPNCTPKIKDNFCPDCLLIEKNIDPKDGKFFDIERVYDVDNPKCKAALQQYVKDNPCDKVANECFGKWFDKKDEVCRQRLDRLLYTACELCCDCIPLGAKPGEYTIDVKRPNCALHFDADNCNYWKDMHDDICDAVDDRDKNAAARVKTEKFLEQIMVDYNCASKKMWDICYMMENGQGRLDQKK